MNAAERAQKLASYASAYDTLREAITHFPKEMWSFKASPDSWTIHAIIVHITDSEVNSYIRGRRFIAEPGSPVLGYDESGWAVALHYENQDTETALELFRWLRISTYAVIKDLPEATWANTVEHSENGTMTMDDWLDTYARHIPDHINQMQEVYAAWLKTQSN